MRSCQLSWPTVLRSIRFWDSGQHHPRACQGFLSTHVGHQQQVAVQGCAGCCAEAECCLGPAHTQGGVSLRQIHRQAPVKMPAMWLLAQRPTQASHGVKHTS